MGRTQFKADQPATRRVAEQVRAMIRARHIGPGGLLPNYHELCVELGVSYMTVKQGLDILEAEDLIRRVPSKGSFVTKDLARASRVLEHIGLIHPSSRKSLLPNKHFLSETMQGIALASPRQGDMHLFSMRDDGLVGAAHLGEWSMDGVLLLEVDNDDYLRAFASWGTPGVVVDYHPGDDVPLDSVSCDNAAAVQQMVGHLAALGHRRVAYLSPYPQRPVYDPRDLQNVLLVRDSSDVRERREESLRVLRERGMLAAEFCAHDINPDWIVRAAQTVTQWLHRPDRPTALLIDCEETAAALLKELRGCDIRVPDDFSICAVAGSGDPVCHTAIPVTYCHFNFVGMGRTAVELLAERCIQPQVDKPRARRIGFTFVEGQTVRTLSKT